MIPGYLTLAGLIRSELTEIDRARGVVERHRSKAAAPAQEPLFEEG